MKNVRKQILDVLKSNPLYLIFLVFTLAFFVYKGISYALLGSMVPLAVILIVLALLLFAMHSSVSAFKRSITLWAILLVIWSGIRILFSIVNWFIKPIPEGHVDAQLGFTGLVFSLAFLLFAIFLLKFKKKIFDKMNVNI